MFCNLKLSVLSLVSLLFFISLGCVEVPVKTTAPVKPVEPAKPSLAIKRNIKDVDFKAHLDEKGPKKRVVILPFLDTSNERLELSRQAARVAFMDDLNKSDEVIALDDSQLKVDLSKYIRSGQYDLTSLAHDVQAVGLTALVEGKIIDLRFKKINGDLKQNEKPKALFEAVVRMRIINVRSGQEIFHVVKTVGIEDEDTRVTAQTSPELFFNKNQDLVTVLVKDAFLDFTPQLISSMNVISWEGRIAALRGDKIYLNVGRISGVQIGDILRVVEDGSEIYDPEIGYNLGKISGRVKGTLEIVSYFGQDGAVSVIHSGAGFKENDRIEQYH